MADQLQLRRGTTAQVLAFTGAQGEVVVNTTNNSLVVQDGVTPGGFPVATVKQVTGATFYYNEDVGSASNAYILTPKSNTLTPSTYQDGIQFGFVTTNANTGPSTANFQSLGVKNLKYPGGVDPLAGEIFGRVYLIYDSSNDWMEIQRKALGPPPQIRTISGTVLSNAMTATLQPCTVDFRAASLGSGSVTPRNITSPLSVTIPAGATLGTASGVLSRIIVLSILGPSGPELAVVNSAGSVNLDETTLINTVAITSGSSSANAVYSTTARTAVPFRVMGSIESTQATAGTWSTVPSAVQGQGGQALAALSAIGYGQSWQNFAGSRSVATTYTNTTGKPICISVLVTSTTTAFATIVAGGTAFRSETQTDVVAGIAVTAIIPAGSTYSVNVSAGTPSVVTWQELR